MEDGLLDSVLRELHSIILTLQTKHINVELEVSLRLTDLYRRLQQERDKLDGL